MKRILIAALILLCTTTADAGILRHRKTDKPARAGILHRLFQREKPAPSPVVTLPAAK